MKDSKTHIFESEIKVCHGQIENEQKIKVEFSSVKAGSTVYLTNKKIIKSGESDLALIVSIRTFPFKWKDKFKIKETEKEVEIGSGVVLNPFPDEFGVKRKKLEFLERLKGDKEEMILALVESRGREGLTEKEMIGFSGIRRNVLEKICLQLEEKGEIKTISFFPLFILAERTFEFLSDKLVKLLKEYHQRNPLGSGMTKDKLKRRLNIRREDIFQLILRKAIAQNKVKIAEEYIALADFKIAPSTEEEKILRRLEKLYYQGKLVSLSLEEIKNQFNLSNRKLDEFIHLLTERNKIVEVKNGYFVHSHWIDELIWKLKKQNRKKITVSDFKKMTNLSRKYAIPLLELLDQLRITRRRGDYREIL
ncbi:MAG: SelB C-terminal domain-containing protein [Candidatus Aminicenantia bacterium]